jgi:histidinol dehydrogenase
MKFLKLIDLSSKELIDLIDRSKDLTEVYPKVREIIEDVKSNGDSALNHYSKKFDNINITDFRVKDEEFKEAINNSDPYVRRAIKKAINNIRNFHEHQSKGNWKWERAGISLGQISRPIQRIGCYIPGGRASYPSTVLMTVIPAQVAGVEEIVCITPPNNEGKVNQYVLLACNMLGIREVYKVGGAQAISALAFGTESISKVDKIVGPGNLYVTAAKWLVSDKVATDFPAGPSEILIIADETANSDYIFLDLLSQGEHDPQAICILITTSEIIAKEVSMKLKGSYLEKKAIIIIAEGIQEALDFANQYAPEHLELLIKKPEDMLEKIKNAGSIFLGEYTPVALGDYASGTNHVLPTSGMAKVFSGLGVHDFIKIMSYQKLDKKNLIEIADLVTTIAEVEGLKSHAESIRKRIEN